MGLEDLISHVLNLHSYGDIFIKDLIFLYRACLCGSNPNPTIQLIQTLI